MSSVTPLANVGIRGMAYYLPEAEVSIDDWARLTAQSETTVQSLKKRGGDRFRAASATETVFSMATEAVKRLFEKDPVPPDTIDLILHSHTLRNSVAPPPVGMAENIRRRFGCSRALTLGLAHQNCASLIGAIAQAHALISTSAQIRRVLVVTADRVATEMSRNIGAFTILSDSASAVLLERDFAFNRIGSHATISRFSSRSRTASGEWIVPASSPSNAGAFTFIEVGSRALSALGDRRDQVGLVLQINTMLNEHIVVGNALNVDSGCFYTENIGRIGHAFCSDFPINFLDSMESRSCNGLTALVLTGGDAQIFNAMTIENICRC